MHNPCWGNLRSGLEEALRWRSEPFDAAWVTSPSHTAHSRRSPVVLVLGCSFPKPDIDAGPPHFNRLDVGSPQGPPSQTAFQRWRAFDVSDAHRVKTNCSPYCLCKLIVHSLLNALHRGTARDDLTSDKGCDKQCGHNENDRWRGRTVEKETGISSQ